MPKNTSVATMKAKKKPSQKTATKPSVRSQSPKKGEKPAHQPFLSRLIRTKLFVWSYAWLALAILLATTALWALLGAHLQNGNADQLVNGYLFADSKTLHGAVFPGQHSQLLKWPLFWLLQLVGYSTTVFTAVTAGIVLFTIAGFAAVIYRIERRPLVFGTLCLALASVLLLVPPQPYPGGLLPVNMAMLTTRNIEYLLYVVSLMLLAKTVRIREWRFVYGVLGLALVIASDKLFMTLSLGGAVLALAAYGIARRRTLRQFAGKWLLASIVATAVATAGVWALNSSKLSQIASSAGSGPYNLVHTAHNVLLGAIYGVLGVFTNLGANPTFEARTLRGIPHSAWQQLASPAGFAFAINLILAVAGLVLVGKLTILSFKQTKAKHDGIDAPIRLALMLIWTSVVAFAAFVATNHYYVVDARYLTIVLFALFVVLASYTRSRRWAPGTLLLAGLLFATSIATGVGFATRTYHADTAALVSTQDRNALVSQVLAQHKVQALVGDYWRVLPIKLAAAHGLQVLPLANCTTPRDVLTSQAWQPDLRTHGFAYLLSLDRGLTDYPQCTTEQITEAYGKPNASVVIAGTTDRPKELLLFYDRGSHRSAPKTNTTSQTANPLVPVQLGQLPHTACSDGQTVMNIVAHQDDDLLFMNPDLLHAVHDGDCVRTVYITAGDAGASKFYWLSREQGSEAAYATMLGVRNAWVQRTAKLANRQFVTVANPVGNSKISLIFMHLPDGNINGAGFAAFYHESLARLEAGKVRRVVSVDGQSSYTADQLVSALTNLLQTYQPDELRMQAPENMSQEYPDHSDHTAAGRFALRAFERYGASILARSYIGYPIHGMPENVADTDLIEKEQAFFAYARFDGGTCRNLEQCDATSTYGFYLRRQYEVPTKP